MLRRWIKIATVSAHVAAPGLTNLKARAVAAYRHVLRRPRQPALQALRHLSVGRRLLVLDVGSASGQGVADIRNLRNDVAVVAFEPNPMFAAVLRRRFASVEAVRVEQLALTDTEGAFTLFVPVYNYTALPDLGTSSRAEAGTWLRGRLIGYREDAVFVAEVGCRASTLDALGLAPDVIVIDTRCDASAVLRGSARTLATAHPIVMLEHVRIDDQCLPLLEAAGYHGFRLERGGGVGVRSALTEPCDLLVAPAHPAAAPLLQWLGRANS